MVEKQAESGEESALDGHVPVAKAVVDDMTVFGGDLSGRFDKGTNEVASEDKRLFQMPPPEEAKKEEQNLKIELA